MAERSQYPPIIDGNSFMEDVHTLLGAINTQPGGDMKHADPRLSYWKGQKRDEPTLAEKCMSEYYRKKKEQEERYRFPL